jgi:hypothetical protein
MPILTTKVWNVDALRASKGELNVDLGKQKLKPTDVLYVIESPLKDQRLTNKWVHNAVIVGNGVALLVY